MERIVKINEIILDSKGLASFYYHVFFVFLNIFIGQRVLINQLEKEDFYCDSKNIYFSIFGRIFEVIIFDSLFNIF